MCLLEKIHLFIHVRLLDRHIYAGPFGLVPAPFSVAGRDLTTNTSILVRMIDISKHEYEVACPSQKSNTVGKPREIVDYKEKV